MCINTQLFAKLHALSCVELHTFKCLDNTPLYYTPSTSQKRANLHTFLRTTHLRLLHTSYIYTPFKRIHTLTYYAPFNPTHLLSRYTLWLLHTFHTYTPFEKNTLMLDANLLILHTFCTNTPFIYLHTFWLNYIKSSISLLASSSAK